MEITVKNNNLQIAPRKVRQVCDLIREKYASEALKILRFCEKKEISIVLTKLINSGLAIADESGQVDLDNLLISSIQVGQGRTMKRFQPRAQGRAFSIRHKSSHITLVFSEV